MYYPFLYLQFISSEILVPLIIKHKTRARLAVAITNLLFDKKTRIKSNCRGRYKKPPVSNKKINWDKDCIKAIDSQRR